MDGCLACDLTEGRIPLPGGRIHATERWVVEHCIGPLGVGTLVVKPFRHVTHVSELDTSEAREIGPLLVSVASVVSSLIEAEQVYVCLWSHAGGEPGHVHWVVQPITSADVERIGVRGPALQTRLFDRDEPLDASAVADFADRARSALASS